MAFQVAENSGLQAMKNSGLQALEHYIPSWGFFDLDVDSSSDVFALGSDIRRGTRILEYSNVGERKALLPLSGKVLCIDGADNLWIGTTSDQAIKKYDQSGNYLGPTLTLPALYAPIRLHADSTYIYVHGGDFESHLFKYTLAGALQWNIPTAITVAAFVETGGIVYGVGNFATFKYSAATGAPMGSFPSVAGPIDADSAGNLWIISSNTLYKYSDIGVLLDSYAVTGGQGLLMLAIDSTDNVYVADAGHKCIHKLNSAGTYLYHWH